MDNTTIFILLLPALISGAVSAIIASQKGRDGLGWFAVGFFFVPIAIPFALVSSPIRNNIENLKNCDYCKELVKHNALKCPHCQSELKVHSDDTSEFQKEHEEKREILTSAREKVIAEAKELGFEVHVTEGSSSIVFKKNGKQHEFLILKRAQDFLKHRRHE